MDISNNMDNVMLDLETTGLDQQHNAIIQISAVKFNPVTQEVSTDFFDRCLLMAPNRYWEEGCRTWWLKGRVETLQNIMARMEDPVTVLKALDEWAGPNPKMWAKPSHFDHSFLDTYYKQFGMQIPFNFRECENLYSFMRARYWPEPLPNFDQVVPFQGTMHNAIYDVLHQIKILFHVLEETK